MGADAWVLYTWDPDAGTRLAMLIVVSVRTAESSLRVNPNGERTSRPGLCCAVLCCAPQVRRQSALAFDQQNEAQHLRKAGHPKVREAS